MIIIPGQSGTYRHLRRHVTGLLADLGQMSEPVTVERQPVVLRDTPEFGLELRDDTEISIDDAFGSPDRPAVVQVGRALRADHMTGTFSPIAALMLR
jgi:hypothetical protein